MKLLRTQSITIHGHVFTLSEFTALDRLDDMEYQVNFPEPVLSDGADLDAVHHHMIAAEIRNLNVITHSLAISLKHGTERFQSLPLADIQEELKADWPYQALTGAYATLINLNKPPQLLLESDSVATEEVVTPEKRWWLPGIWLKK
ncbi:phage minor tail protein G [Vibrio furnissii]|uniref:phage minor tail protein G n=1 Tax=Vibrio furnissii TaxID=29494 RepID=UPI001EE9C769|nr:phage minor tail protein G [Vibrio furnissii]MCG6216273.1 hypothetical protein [Vibrio furnissii]